VRERRKKEKGNKVRKIDSRDNRTWFQNNRIFLVDKPLTFGHSQIEMQCQKETEEERFGQASLLIEIAIKIFRKAFVEKKIHEKQQFKELAEDTETHGEYIKTLILRSSANENANQYKIHVVPYFRSHADDCKRLFHDKHRNCCEEKTGGLLGWLGKKETQVDNWDDIQKAKLADFLIILAEEFKKLV
jgi:hypothetical protein